MRFLKYQLAFIFTLLCIQWRPLLACKIMALGDGEYISCRDEQCRSYEPVIGLLADQLVAAAYAGNIERIDQLIKNGAIPDKPSKEQGHLPLLAAANAGKELVVSKLIEAGAKVDQEGLPGGTALISSINNRSIGIAEILLKNGAPVDQAKKDKETALMCAAHQGRLDLVNLFLAHDAQVDKVNEDGLSALARAAIMGRDEIVLVLLKRRASIALAKQGISQMWANESTKSKANKLLDVFDITMRLRKLSSELVLSEQEKASFSDKLDQIESIILTMRKLPWNVINFTVLIQKFHEIRDLNKIMDAQAQSDSNHSLWIDLSKRLIPALRMDRGAEHPTWDGYFNCPCST